MTTSVPRHSHAQRVSTRVPVFAALAIGAVLAMALSACKPSTDDASNTTDTTAVTPKPDPKPAPAAGAGDTAPPSTDTPVADGKPEMPTLQVTTVDGKPYDLASKRGKWVVVNFWATWCAPCLKEMPELSALDAMREQIEVIGLAYEDIAVADMQAFLKTHPVVYPIAIIDVMNPPEDFATPRGLPMTYLIDPAGKVARQFLGPITARDIEDAIGKASGKPAT